VPEELVEELDAVLLALQSGGLPFGLPVLPAAVPDEDARHRAEPHHEQQQRQPLDQRGLLDGQDAADEATEREQPQQRPAEHLGVHELRRGAVTDGHQDRDDQRRGQPDDERVEGIDVQPVPRQECRAAEYECDGDDDGLDDRS